MPAGRPASFHVRYHQVVNSEMSIAKLNSYAGYPDDMDMGMGTGAPRNSGFGLSEDPFVDHYMQDTLFIDIANANGSRSHLAWKRCDQPWGRQAFRQRAGPDRQAGRQDPRRLPPVLTLDLTLGLHRSSPGPSRRSARS